MTQGTIKQRQRLFERQLFGLVDNQRAARQKGHPLRQCPPVGNVLPAKALILRKAAGRAAICRHYLHLTPLFVRHHGQLRYPLTLTSGPPLTGHNRHRQTVLRQHADRVRVGSGSGLCFIRKGINRPGPLQVTAQGRHRQFVEHMNV